MASKGGVLPDDPRFRKLCREGNMKKIRDFLECTEPQVLEEKILHKKGVFGYTPLHEAVASGKPEVLECLLDFTGNANVNCRANSGYTPLHLAASSGHSECVRVLLSRGADMNCGDNSRSGYTPLHLAACSGHSECVRVLLSRGADVNCVDDCGKTPKQTAKLSSKSSIVKLLHGEGELV